MGASVQPDPQDVARIQANVAKMRAANPPASEDEVLAYLQHEDAQASAPQPESTLKGFGRSVLQHGLFNFGDELGVVDPAKQAQFAKAHKFLDGLGTVVGGSIAPIAAAVAAPELATAGGAAALGGATGLLSGAGEGTDLESRSKKAAEQGALGFGLGGVMARFSQLAGKTGSAIADRIVPQRVASRVASSLFDDPDAVQAHIDEMNQIAPGSASIATATRPPIGLDDVSRFTGTVRNLGASGTTAKAAEADMLAQHAAQGAGLDALGGKMDALTAKIPVTPDMRRVLAQVSETIGPKRTPDIPTNATRVNIQELRKPLSHLRYMLRQGAERGTEANGATMNELQAAHDKLEALVYKAAPDFENLDRQYAKMMDERRTLEPLMKTAQRSRSNHGGSELARQEPTTLGGSITTNPRHGITDLLAKAFQPGKEIAPKLTQRFITSPAGPDAVANLLDAGRLDRLLKATARARRGIGIGTASQLPAGMKSLFDNVTSAHEQP